MNRMKETDFWDLLDFSISNKIQSFLNVEIFYTKIRNVVKFGSS